MQFLFFRSRYSGPPQHHFHPNDSLLFLWNKLVKNLSYSSFLVGVEMVQRCAAAVLRLGDLKPDRNTGEIVILCSEIKCD